MAIVVDAVNGVEYGTRRMMDYAGQRGLCRAIIINRIDRDGADPARVLQQLREVLVLPLNLRADDATPRGGLLLADGEATWDRWPTGIRKIIDQVVEINETAMEHYLETGEDGLSPEELHDAFEQCLREGCHQSRRRPTPTAWSLRSARCSIASKI